jgi:hypothetical protein
MLLLMNKVLIFTMRGFEGEEWHDSFFLDLWTSEKKQGSTEKVQLFQSDERFVGSSIFSISREVRTIAGLR